MVRNIRAVYAHATIAERTKGAAWYPTAEHGCKVWSAKYHVDARTVAAVIAALSPQCEWMQNLRAALNIVSGEFIPLTGPSRPLERNRRKAVAIYLEGALSPDDYFKDGWKVKAFARNLSGDTSVVTVDTHALQSALGDPTIRHQGIGRAKPYAAVAAAYIAAAAAEGIEPSTIQAITWLTWKRMYSPGTKRTMLKKAGA
jgi:hypothetical protein